MIVDRSFDWQSVLLNDYSYFTNVCTSHEIPDDFNISELKVVQARAQENEVHVLDDSDFVWSKYKHSNISVVQKMIDWEVKQL